jgi:VWFA-related protein
MNRAKQSFLRSMAMAGAVSLAIGAGIGTQRASADNTQVPVTVTVTATSRGDKMPPVVPQNEVIVKQQSSNRKVVSWAPVQPEGGDLEVAVLIDDSLTMHVGNDLNDVRDFVRHLPANAKVAVAYAQYGTAHYQQAFTADHAAAAEAFRLPSAIPGSSNGLFDSVRDLIKHWPASDARHVMVLVSSGIDLTNGVADTDPGMNRPLQQAIEAAQQNGVMVYAIFAPSSSRDLRGNELVSTNGQGSLNSLADETGGKAFLQGYGTPVSMQPYLNSIQQMIGQQYRLTFLADATMHGGSSRLHVSTEQNGVELHAPEYIRVPGSK